MFNEFRISQNCLAEPRPVRDVQIYMKAKNRLIRAKWARERVRRTVNDWQKNLFGDKCKFSLRSNGRVHVWTKRGTRYGPKSSVAESSSRFSFMFWEAYLVQVPLFSSLLKKHTQQPVMLPYYEQPEKRAVNEKRFLRLAVSKSFCPAKSNISNSLRPKQRCESSFGHNVVTLKTSIVQIPDKSPYKTLAS